jgi:pimeloyl-ACP methyl ester carboxylesterase
VSLSTGPAASKNSTNVRVRMGERAARLGFRVLAPAAPDLTAALADRLFCTPPRSRPSARIQALLDGACRRDLNVGGVRLATWRWGTGPLVLLAHGWGGLGGQLAAFVGPLLARGFSVMCFDAPGHGRSAGRRSSLVEFARALRGVADAEGPVHAVIAHSLGAAAAALALRNGLRAERAVFVGAPADPEAWTTEFARRLGIAAPVLHRMRSRIETRLGVRWSQLRVLDGAPSQRTPLLLLHDLDDAEVAWSDSAALAEAWPGARLVSTRGLGHRRILRDPAVVAQAVDFAAEAAARQRDGDMTSRLEAEMFDRDLRWRRRGAPLPEAARLQPQRA